MTTFLLPGSQKIFRGRPNISVGQPILVHPNITQPKHVVTLFQKYDLEVDLFKKGWPKISLGQPFSFCEPG